MAGFPALRARGSLASGTSAVLTSAGLGRGTERGAWIPAPGLKGPRVENHHHVHAWGMMGQLCLTTKHLAGTYNRRIETCYKRPMTKGKLYTSLSPNTISTKPTIHFQRPRLITPSTDQHYLFDSEDDFHSGSFQNYSHPIDHTRRTTDSPGFKSFTTFIWTISCFFDGHLAFGN